MSKGYLINLKQHHARRGGYVYFGLWYDNIQSTITSHYWSNGIYYTANEYIIVKDLCKSHTHYYSQHTTTYLYIICNYSSIFMFTIIYFTISLHVVLLVLNCECSIQAIRNNGCILFIHSTFF